jgi:hypothetical protein
MFCQCVFHGEKFMEVTCLASARPDQAEEIFYHEAAKTQRFF